MYLDHHKMFRFEHNVRVWLNHRTWTSIQVQVQVRWFSWTEPRTWCLGSSSNIVWNVLNWTVVSWTIFHSISLPFNPNLIPSLPNLPPMFPPFPPFPDSITSSLRHSSLVASSPVTRHPSPVTRHIVTPSFRLHYSSLSVSVIIVLRYFGSLPPLLSSEHHSRLCGWMITI